MMKRMNKLGQKGLMRHGHVGADAGQWRRPYPEFVFLGVFD